MLDGWLAAQPLNSTAHESGLWSGNLEWPQEVAGSLLDEEEYKTTQAACRRIFHVAVLPGGAAGANAKSGNHENQLFCAFFAHHAKRTKFRAHACQNYEEQRDETRPPARRGQKG